MTVPELEKKLEDKSTVNSLEHFLGSVCDKLPKMQSQCKDVVKDYLPTILNALAHLPAGNFCSDIHLCSSSKTLQTPLLKLPRVNPTLCITCMAICDGVDMLLSGTPIVGNITHFFSQVCDILPKEATCKTVLESYVPRVIKDIVSFTPREDCEFFGLCESQSWLK